MSFPPFPFSVPSSISATLKAALPVTRFTVTETYKCGRWTARKPRYYLRKGKEGWKKRRRRREKGKKKEEKKEAEGRRKSKSRTKMRFEIFFG